MPNKKSFAATRSLTTIISFLLVFAALASGLVVASAGDADAKLLETGEAAKNGHRIPLPADIKIVSYNIRWRGGDDLDELIQLLGNDKEIGKASIIGLQEVDRNKERTNNTNTVRKIAEELGMHYAWAAPPPPSSKKNNTEEETGVAILSPFPLTDVTRIVLPNEGPGGRRRVGLGATVRIGSNQIRVYSVHAEIRTSNEKRLSQLNAIIHDLRTHHGEIKYSVVLGDFNTLTPNDVDSTSRLFKGEGFSTPFSNDDSTWRTFLIRLKLDWLWLKGFNVVGYGIDKKVGMSDHWPLWTTVKLKEDK